MQVNKGRNSYTMGKLVWAAPLGTLTHEVSLCIHLSLGDPRATRVSQERCVSPGVCAISSPSPILYPPYLTERRGETWAQQSWGVPSTLSTRLSSLRRAAMRPAPGPSGSRRAETSHAQHTWHTLPQCRAAGY